MKINNNTWNKIRYTIYTPIYDAVANYFAASRLGSINSLDIKEGSKILIIGAGTGLDVEFLPKHCHITATDITPAMVKRIEKRNKKLGHNLDALVMDGQNLSYENETFDIVILHLILAVIPDPKACILETYRVLKPGGQVAIFDKFLPKDEKLSAGRKFVNIFSNILATNITRSLEAIVSVTKFKIISDQDANFNGNFRRLLLVK